MQRAAARRELLAALLYAVVVGVVASVVGAITTAPTLAGAAAPEIGAAVRAAIHLDPSAVVLTVALAALTIIGATVILDRRVDSAARRPAAEGR